ncbi:LysR family transcriptional regulator [Rhodopseudomonas palustris]|uniref:LysR family transcriptional regulator n=1 Tax=Rhodopseudomonas palustris TaxID=1076 RepID=A0AAX3DT05_RHOPL|nr:LysR substrate-binding domain-containing protein [Rhodopseudomonas palustris]UYO37726.1 LysR family transcriptional regulator [Rhodopseudomonas palustris]
MLAPLDLRLLQTFIVLVQTGSFSETSRRLGRTQPAVSLQLNRLEEATGAPLFTKVGRKLVLTNHGELVLGYARTIMGLQDELRARLAAPKLDGVVVLGMPDLYAAYLLPGILADFRSAYPNVDVELKCALSSKLMASVERAEIDLAIVTGMPAFKVGELVAQEELVWVASERSSVHLENPVPLAMLPPGNIFRDFGLAALESIGRIWRLSCISESISGIQAAVFSGIAVSVVGKSSVLPGMRMLGRSDTFPALPKVDLVLYRSARSSNPAAEALASVIVRHFANSTLAPAARFVRTQAGSGSHE